MYFPAYVITTHFEEYCHGIYDNTGVNCFWIINNSQQVLEKLHTINHFTKAKHFDFCTLYTSIPHVSKISTYDFHPGVRNCVYLHVVVNKFGKAYWSDIPSKSSCSTNIKEDKLIEMLEFLIDNIYIKVGKDIFRQQIGIPMGTDCASFLANLFLFYYEYNYMKDLIKSNIYT